METNDGYVYATHILCQECGWYTKVFLSPGAYIRQKPVTFCPICGVENPRKSTNSPDRSKEMEELEAEVRKLQARLKEMRE